MNATILIQGNFYGKTPFLISSLTAFMNRAQGNLEIKM